MKVVVNQCYGGFSLSYDGVMEYAKRKGITLYAYNATYKGSGKYEYVPADSGTFLTYFTKPKPEATDEDYFSSRDIERNDPILVALIEDVAWGSAKVSGAVAKLAVVEIPDDVEWRIAEYDGMEWVEEAHRTWS